MAPTLAEKNTTEEKEDSPIRTMQGDISLLQRGEYKPRYFVTPKTVPQAAPINIWDKKEEERPTERLEQFEFKTPQESEEPKADEPLTLAQISRQLSEKHEKEPQQKIEPAIQEPPKQEEIILPSTFEELRNIPEIDVLGLDQSDILEFSQKSFPPADLPLKTESKSPAIETIKIMGEIPSEGKMKDSIGEHDILGLDKYSVSDNQQQDKNLIYPEKNNIGSEIEKPQKRSFKLNFSLRITGIIALAIIAVGALGIGGGYLFLSSRNTEQGNNSPTQPQQPNTPVQPSPQEPPLPENILPTVSDMVVTVESFSQASSQINASLPALSLPNNFTRLLIKIKNQDEIRYLGFIEVLQALGINLPESIISNLDLDTGTVFSYGQIEGTRVGFAARMKNKDAVTQSASLWEETAYENIKNLLYIFGNPEPPTNMTFLDNYSYTVPIRYLNLPTPELTVDYAMTDSLFIFTSSRSSIFSLLETLGN